MSAKPKAGEEWIEWTCPACSAKIDDPISIKETTCACGVVVYLGKVHRGQFGASRRAYLKRRERSKQERKDRTREEMFAAITTGRLPKRFQG